MPIRIDTADNADTVETRHSGLAWQGKEVKGKAGVGSAGY